MPRRIEKVCPKCRRWKPMTRHHVYPKRFFGTKGNRMTFHLCRECHDKLEYHIPFHPQLEKDRYVRILLNFLEGKYDAT